jgi:hypothetical protein
MDRADNIILSEQDLIDLTQKKRRSAQRRVLAFLRITYRLRPDGSLVVHRAQVDAALGGLAESPNQKLRKTEPNWAD